VSATTPGQAAYEAFTAVRYAGSLTTDWSSPTIARKAWEAAAQAAIDAATEGALRAKFEQARDAVIESHMARHPQAAPQAAPGSRSFEDMLADPREQFDPRSELLASISEYAAAPPTTAGIQPRHPGAARVQPAPGLAAAGRPATSLEDAMLRNIDGLNDLVRDMLQSFPDTVDEPQWRDRAGELHVCDPDGQPYRAITEEDL
jgi:hypothetical protein